LGSEDTHLHAVLPVSISQAMGLREKRWEELMQKRTSEVIDGSQPTTKTN